MEEEQKKDSFVHETIKNKPVNKKKLFRRTVTTVVFAIVFGLIACLTFLLIEPVINRILNPEKISKVEFPEEEEEVSPEELLTEQTVLQQEEEQKQAVIEAKKQAEEAQREAEASMQKDVTIEDYQELYSKFYELACQAEKSIATVTSISRKEDWFSGTLENENTASGLIVANNGAEILVLADTANLQSDGDFFVRFCDKKLVDAKLKQKDSQTGLAVFSVSLGSIEKETLDEIEIATLGSSTSDGTVGTPVIAVGSPIGTSGSLAYGMITSNGTKLGLTDTVYHVLMTDMTLAQNASGVLVDLDGEVLGILTDTAGQSSVAAALGISDLKKLIAKLSNDELRAYIGIRGMDVTEDAHNETGVPYGAYVTEVISQSPAMIAGVLNGDVIVKLGTHTISSFREYKSLVLSLSPQTIVEVTVMRYDGTQYHEITLEITTGEAE